LDTLSPRFSSTSLILPAVVAGTSLDALSVSSGTRGGSTSMTSPALTSTSTTPPSLEVPVSRAGRSTPPPATPRAGRPARRGGGGEGVGEEGGETGRHRTVDDAMIVRQRQRQHEARHEAAFLEYRPHARARHAENRHLGCVDDRCERGAADAAEARDREAAAL